MAATIPEYVDPLIHRQHELAQLLGVSMLLVDVQTYRVNLTILSFLGVVMKALHDHGVVLDAEWLARLDTIDDVPWPAWLLNQTPPT